MRAKAAPTDGKLKVFISSKMAELRDVREIVGKALKDSGIQAHIYEEHAGARPENVVSTSLAEVEDADIYVGLFWQNYGDVTVQEYQYARQLGKPCFVYIRFWELARVVVPGAKAILTYRTEHFPQAQEGRALLNAELQASTAALSGEPPQFEVLELAQFDDAQVRQLLALRTGRATVERIMRDVQLLDLARRPVMAELILEALPEIEAGKPVDMSRVHLYAVRRKLERDIKDERTFTSLADKLYFMCELSWEMLSTDQMSLNYRLFPDHLRRLFGLAVQEQKDLDHWHYDMMGQTLLIRNADGDYTPAHRSLLEFFVAYKFAAELGVLAADFADLARAQSYVDASAAPKEYTWSEYFRREVDGKGSLKPIPPLQSFVTENMSRLLRRWASNR